MDRISEIEYTIKSNGWTKGNDTFRKLPSAFLKPIKK
jgi:hypothetical protein